MQSSGYGRWLLKVTAGIIPCCAVWQVKWLGDVCIAARDREFRRLGMGDGAAGVFIKRKLKNDPVIQEPTKNAMHTLQVCKLHYIEKNFLQKSSFCHWYIN
jgi:hypothetical protein